MSIEEIEIESKSLDGFIAKSANWYSETYRGITLTEDEFNIFKGYKKGDLYSDKAFFSTSQDKAVATKFNANTKWQVEMTIHGKNGVDISHFSAFPEEKEVLFACETNFKIETLKSMEEAGKYGKIYVTLREL